MTNEEINISINVLTKVVEVFEVAGAPNEHPVCIKTHKCMCECMRGFIEVLNSKIVED
jgi:hypothetical protein